MKKLFGTFLFLVCCFLTESAYAATLYIDPSNTQMHPGDTLSLAVRIDTDDDECINVVDGIISYSANIEPVDISRGNSILPVWVEEPTVDKDKQQITFAGGIPNGYCGRIDGDPRLTNVVLEMIFQAPGLSENSEDIEEVANVSFAQNTRVLLNDGAGTNTELQTFGATIAMNTTPGSEVVNEWRDTITADTINPSGFSISLNSDPSIFSGKYFIVFNTTDKQSGIDHYEVIEEPLDEVSLFGWGGVDAPWVEARSPYKLTDQTLNSTIRVKAVDKAGNEYIAVYVPDESVRHTSHNLLLYIGIATIMIIFGGVLAVWWYRRKQNREADALQHSETLTAQDEDPLNQL